MTPEKPSREGLVLALTEIVISKIKLETGVEAGVMIADPEVIVGLVVDLLSAFMIRHPEWLAGHAQRIVAERFPDPPALDRLWEWVQEMAG